MVMEEYEHCTFGCDDVIRRGARQQKAKAAGYRTRAVTDGLLHAAPLEAISILEQILNGRVSYVRPVQPTKAHPTTCPQRPSS